MLYKKVYRSIWKNKRAYIACMFLIAVGIMMRTAMGVAADGLATAKLNFYEEYRLADVWADVGAISQSDAERLRALTGIADVTARTKMEVRAELDGSDEMITLRLISFDPANELRLNDFQMTGMKPLHPQEIALNYMFMNANGLDTGDSIRLIVHGRTFTFETTGSFLSPEYVYIAPSFTDILPDNAGFGIAYITAEAMGNITGRHGIANNVLFSLESGYEFEDVRLVLMDALASHGLISLTQREDQLSYAIINMQTESIQGISVSMPLVFMVMAAVVLYLMMKRIIEQERVQIGTLKALGFSNAKVIFHYVCYGAIVGLVGGLVGFAMGAAMSGVYLEMFLEFYVLPELVQPISPTYLLFAMAVSLGTGVLGSLMGAVSVTALIPADAMRPESPKPVKYDIVGKIKPLKFILTSRGQMSLRGILRNPMRSGFVILGVTFSFGLLCVFGSMEHLIDAMIYSQFTDQRLYNVRVTLTHPIAYDRAVEAAYGVRYITQAEGLLQKPVSLTAGHLQVGTVITGVPAYGELYRIFDTNRRTNYAPPSHGIMLTNGLADNLNATAGSLIFFESPFLPDGIYIPVTQIIEQNLGSGAYMELSALSEIFGESPIATAIIFNTNNLPYIMDYFRNSQFTAAIEDKDTTMRKYYEMMEPYMGIFMVLNIMGALVAFAIIYNTATISLSERKREYATLRVVGLSTNEVCEIMRFEYWVLGFIGMAIGAPFASGLMVAVNNLMDTAMFSMPSTLPAAAYITGILGCSAAIMLSNFSAKRKIAKFDMVEVLKEF
ncbi:MAG: ABC transporter permease [Defluviitaleaceae bacterium]|nr:ABC transporter permease [Defluviitaleaceae bacterium]MCL2262531.1 ABC transporter permease [Defluviitaleaceae bacterium]